MNKERLTDKERKKLGILVIVIFFLFMGIISYFIGKPILEFIREPEKFRAWVDERGIVGKILFMLMVVFQIVVAMVPGEPFEIGAGYAFGIYMGTLLYMIGVAVGSFLIFIFVRRFGIKVVEIFFSMEKIRNLKILRNTQRVRLLMFLIFALPGTPKDLLSYIVGLTDIKLSEWMVIATVVRIPSIITSIVGGNALAMGKYKAAAIIFLITIPISIAGYFLYVKYTSRHSEKHKDQKNEITEKGNE